MSATLQDLQRGLQTSVLHGDDGFASAIESSVEHPAALRLGIYADAYRVRLIEALESNFPALAKAMRQFEGEHAFTRLAQLYLAMHPSQHFSVRWFGHRLAEFLAELPEYRDRVWLTELAVWEWRVAAAFDAGDAPVLRIEDLGAIAPEAWSSMRFTLQPAIQRIALITNAVALSKAGDTMPSPEQFAERVEWLIYRKDLNVEYRSLDALEAKAFDAARTGATFGELCAQLAETLPEGEVPLRAASFLKQWTVDHCLVRTEI